MRSSTSAWVIPTSTQPPVTRTAASQPRSNPAAASQRDDDQGQQPDRRRLARTEVALRVRLAGGDRVTDRARAKPSEQERHDRKLAAGVQGVALRFGAEGEQADRADSA